MIGLIKDIKNIGGNITNYFSKQYQNNLNFRELVNTLTIGTGVGITAKFVSYFVSDNLENVLNQSAPAFGALASAVTSSRFLSRVIKNVGTLVYLATLGYFTPDCMGALGKSYGHGPNLFNSMDKFAHKKC